ncbi:hypothetical protein ALC57_02243 [Trachymyrmex cornetzi]|uniref:Uncharacterized protein n=1 Tax=Trachymyrmex cornetzi TaxID=471704 RepID=A0A151JNT0_9HYME|nr:hypothetical protein ALC57_02243 [Trachymyrmex cornetzi]
MINYFCLHPHVANNKLKGMLRTWRDTKTKVSNKVTSLKKNRAATGNEPNDIVLTERDKKVIDLIGHEYIEGLATVPDSFPEEFVSWLLSFKRLIFDDVCVSSLLFNRKTYLSNWSKD